MYSELRIDINQEVDVVGHDLGLEQDAVRFLSHFGHDLLEPPIDPLTSAWRRYFGQKTTWSLHEKTMLRFDRHFIREYMAMVYIII